MRSNKQAPFQTSPTSDLRQQLWFNLARAAASVGHRLEVGLRPFGLSPTQYNVLCVLRLAGADGLCQYQIGESLIAQVPDVPRIVDRMAAAGWVRRERSSADRRLVLTTLTEQGRNLVDQLDEPMQMLEQSIFAGLTETQMTALNELLQGATP